MANDVDASTTGARTRPWRTAVLGGFASYLDSATIVAGGTAWVLYSGTLGLDAWDIGALSAILTFTLAIGALVGGRLGDRFGRKRVFSIDLLVLAGGLALLTLAPSSEVLFVGVVVTGFAMGADIPVSLALIAEDAPPDKRSTMVAFSQLMWIFGIVASQVLGFAVSGLGELGARILFGHVLVVAVVVWLLRRRLPESGRWSEAARSRQNAPRPAGRRTTHRGSLRDLLPFTAPLVATALFYTLNNLSANTMGQFQVYLFTEVVGVTVTTATLVVLLGVPLGLGSNFLFMKVAGRPGRMPAFVVGSTLLVVGFAVPVVLGFSFTTLLVASLLSSFGGGLAGEAIYKVWSQELFPTLVRSSAQGSTIFVTRTLTAGFAFVTPAIALSNPRLLVVLLMLFNLGAFVVGLLWIRRLPTAVEAEDAAEREHGDVAHLQPGATTDTADPFVHPSSHYREGPR